VRYYGILTPLPPFSERLHWAGRVAQVIEYLPSKCEVLSLNPSSRKKSMWIC
jgi:hypothetical protein